MTENTLQSYKHWRNFCTIFHTSSPPSIGGARAWWVGLERLQFLMQYGEVVYCLPCPWYRPSLDSFQSTAVGRRYMLLPKYWYFVRRLRGSTASAVGYTGTADFRRQLLSGRATTSSPKESISLHVDGGRVSDNSYVRKSMPYSTYIRWNIETSFMWGSLRLAPISIMISKIK